MRPVPNRRADAIADLPANAGRYSTAAGWQSFAALATLLPPTPTLGWPPPSVPPSSSLEELTELLSGLPSGTIFLAFVEVQKAPHGDLTGVYIEDQILPLTRGTGGVLSEEMLFSAGIKRAAFGITANSGAGILHGDFSGFIELLRQAPELADGAGDFGPPSILDAYREVEVFLFPYYADLYLYIAVPDPGTMLLAHEFGIQEAGIMEEIIDRYLDGSELDESLAGLLDAVGPMDFLVARRWDPEPDRPPEAASFRGGGG